MKDYRLSDIQAECKKHKGKTPRGCDECPLINEFCRKFPNEWNVDNTTKNGEQVKNG